jgi:hypothetical protein
VRADTQIRDYCGTAAYCWERYRDIWDEATRRGSAVAWHLHYFDRAGRQDTSEANVLENIRVGSEALDRPCVVHMGWTFQSDSSIRHLYAAGVRVDYSPLPRVRTAGRNGVDAIDWSGFEYRPTMWHGVRMIPAFTMRHRLLGRRFGSEYVMLTTTTAPVLYRLLLDRFFRTDASFFVSYFHADELVPAVGGWRNHLYSFGNLRRNLDRLSRLAARHRREIRFVTIPELADVLFPADADHSGHP